MKSLGWKSVQIASLLLGHDERTIVLGDLVESGEACAHALVSVLDLAIRRQIGLWRHWQPWLALLGIAGLSGYALSGLVLTLDSGLAIQTRTYLHYGVHYEMGVSAMQDFAFLICALLALSVWSWTSGFVLGFLSGRSVWLTGLLFYAVVAASSSFVFALMSRHTVQKISGHQLPLAVVLLILLLPIRLARLCFLIAAAWGVTYGVRRITLTAGQSSALTVIGLGAIFLMLWTSGWYEDAKGIISNGAWRAIPWTKRIIPFLLMSWPVIYLAGTNRTFGGKLGIYHESA